MLGVKRIYLKFKMKILFWFPLVFVQKGITDYKKYTMFTIIYWPFFRSCFFISFSVLHFKK